MHLRTLSRDKWEIRSMSCVTTWSLGSEGTADHRARSVASSALRGTAYVTVCTLYDIDSFQNIPILESQA